MITHNHPDITGYFMLHKDGQDVGFSWRPDDPVFGPNWERVPAGPALTQKLHHILLDALRWSPKEGQAARLINEAIHLLEVK